MADSTLKKLIELIQTPKQPDRRLAAVQVAGAIGPPKERGLVKALLAVVEDGDPELRHSAIEALGQLRAEEALPRLVALVQQGGADVETAAQAAGHLGVRGVKALGKVMAQAAPVLKRRIAGALALSGTESAAVATAQALLDEDPSVVDAAARSLAAELSSFTPGQRRTLADFLTQSLQTKSKPGLSAATEAAMIRVLAGLHEAKAEEVYWGRLEPGRPPEIRAAALGALGTLPPPTAEARVQRLLACAADTDFRIVAPALLLLRNVPVNRKTGKHWLRLLEAPDVAARRFAVERLREVPDEATAQALAAQLHHPDRALRDDALAALRSAPVGRKALLEALLVAPTPEEAWSLARAQAPAARELPAAERQCLFQQAAKLQDQEDRRAEPLWFLLREIDTAWVRDRIEERALALRKKKNYPGAVTYLRLLTRDPACSEDVRFELAATGLRLTAHDTGAAARAGDPVLGQFARLLENRAFDLIGRITKEKWLDAEDLFYLGFHFAEQTHQAKEFGQQVLELVIKRAPRSEVGKNAKRKLKSEGLN